MSGKLLTAGFLSMAIAVTLLIVHARPVATSRVSTHEAGESRGISFQTEAGLQALLFEVRPFGFIPAETVVPSGKYLLVLQNRSGRRGLTFRLDRENEGRLSESNPEKRDWKMQIQLAPGTYILTEVGHPQWRSVIRVTTR